MTKPLISLLHPTARVKPSAGLEPERVKWRVIEPIFNLPKADKSVEVLELV